MKSARARVALIAAAFATCCGLYAAIASGDGFASKRAHTFVVGAPEGPSPMAGVDARRSGFSGSNLPRGRLKLAWTRSLGSPLQTAPIVTLEGDVFAMTTRGQLVFVSHDGEEKWRAGNEARSSAPALLADGTVVIVNAVGEAVGLRDGAVRWRTRISNANQSTPPAPLPLDDGGVVVLSENDLATLDHEGAVVTRASLPEHSGAAIVGSARGVLVTDVNGVVYAWHPGGEPTRLGSFDSPLDGDAVLANDHDLVAVSLDGNRVLDFDLARGISTTRALAPSGIFLGPPAIFGDGVALFLFLGRTYAISLDARGQETSRTLVAADMNVGADAGAALVSIIAHAAPLVDSRGAIAYASAAGDVGVVSPSGEVESFSALCSPKNPHPQPAATSRTSLAPAGAGAFVAACGNGTLAKVISEQGHEP